MSMLPPEKGRGRTSEFSPAKRAQILAGAREMFGRLGFERASVDAIAARAGVSKATIYNHFQDKKALFLAALGEETESTRRKFLTLLDRPTWEIEEDLHQIGASMLRLVCSPANAQRSRIVASELDRFPGLGKELYACSQRAGHGRLASFLEEADRRGLLAIDDPVEAAIDFAALCCGDFGRQLHLGVIDQVDDEMVERRVRRAVRTFLRAYGRPASDR